MQFRVSVACGQPINSCPQNNILNSASGSWQPIVNAVPGRPVRIQGVYWTSLIAGSYLKIKDISGGIWYHAVCFGGDFSVDILPTSLTLMTPLEYFDSIGSNQIIIYGEYV